MKNQHKIYSSLFVLLLCFTGCKKYVDIKTQGTLVPGETSNYRLLLNNTRAFEFGSAIGDYSSDDVAYIDGSTQMSSFSPSEFSAHLYNAYRWNNVLYPSNSRFYYNDSQWSAIYGTITYANTIIAEVASSTGGTEQEKAQLIAEARVHRADAYLMLVNTYCKPYIRGSAQSDLGVPLIITPTTSQSLARPSLQSVYDQIILDLETAIPALPNLQAFNTLPSKASAYAELARCYLYMNDYANANTNADRALALRSTLVDLGSYATIANGNYPIRGVDPEILLSKLPTDGISAYTPTAFRLSTDLLALLGTSDQRYNLFTVPATTISSTYATAGGRFFSRDLSIGEARNIGPNVPEMMLIKAEYYARNNDISNAILWMDRLRIRRFKKADYVPSTAANAQEALAKVIDERHREFFCRMLRWWDMRRLKSEPAFQRTYTRVVNGATLTLAPSSDRYVFPIADYLRQLNPELQANP
ncbi:RagB/SusD family nutrient uptake outer membrane protein [Pedobacter agri]|uniref:RagB/SusD family nutrient uptake outer membrane protein n=1 Tax=Pedobacter agri TaxID=454586 RepID=UPI0029306F79|nr:RagB/SusD family nutrient uptake outer membrane protein [Pedobacter agri]